MPEKLSWIKIGCTKRGIKIADLSRKLNVEHSRMYRMISGFVQPIPGLETTIRKYFDEIDNALQKKEAQANDPTNTSSRQLLRELDRMVRASSLHTFYESSDLCYRINADLANQRT